MSSDPAHLCYVGDYFTDPEVMFFNMEKYGTYRKVIDYLYLNKGYLAVNWQSIALLLNVKRRDKAEKMFQEVAHKFQIIDGQITHKRVLEELQKRARYKLMQQNKGKKGAEARWKKDSNGHATPECPTPPSGQCPNDGTPSSSSFPSSSSNNTYIQEDQYDPFDNPRKPPEMSGDLERLVGIWADRIKTIPERVSALHVNQIEAGIYHGFDWCVDAMKKDELKHCTTPKWVFSEKVKWDLAHPNNMTTNADKTAEIRAALEAQNDEIKEQNNES